MGEEGRQKMAVLLTVPLVKRNYWPVFIFDIGKLTNNNNILSNSPQSAGAVAGRAGFFSLEAYVHLF